MNNKGLTLIELLLTVLIISIVAALSTGFYSKFLLQNNVTNVQDQLIQQLRKAQAYAVAGKQNNSWGVFYSLNRITLFSGTSYQARDTSFDETFNINTNVSVTGPGTVIFSRGTGIPNLTGTITIQSFARNESISINAQGIMTR